MSAFLQLRLWLREAPGPERALTGIAGLIIAAVLAVTLLPVGGGGAPTPTALAGSTAPASTAGSEPTVAPGPTQAPGQTGTTGTPGGGAVVPGQVTADPLTRSTSGPYVASKGAACGGRTASGPGVTSSTVKVVTTNLSLAGPVGNSTFDVRPDLAAIAQALVDDINQKGGVACGRKIVLKQYDVNPLDSTDQQSTCLQIQRDAPLIVIDFGGYLTPASRSCFAQAKIPMTAGTPFGADELKSSYPYVFGMRNVAEQSVHNGILGLAARGFFTTPKLTKVGLFEDNCGPTANKQIDADLARIGIKSSQVSKFVLECNVAAPPNQIAQAVLQHSTDHVSHVFMATSNTNEENYVRIAKGQDLHPRYGVSDYGESMTQSGAENWDASFDGAVGITSSHIGEFSSGITNPVLKACDATMKRHGVPGFTSERKDTAVASYCDLFKLFTDIMAKAGVNPKRESLAPALATLGTFTSGYVSDGLFNRPGKITGGDFQRMIRFHADCGCWKIVDKTLARGYA